jgi:rhodanese-related sulfurtransferase
VALVDLREKSERERHGTIPGALHEPYPKLQDNLATHGLLRALGANRRVVFFCAYGERSAMAVQAAQEAGIISACHIQGGIAAWKAAGGPIERLSKGDTP